jgi:hypothetical protein
LGDFHYKPSSYWGTPIWLIQQSGHQLNLSDFGGWKMVMWETTVGNQEKVEMHPDILGIRWNKWEGMATRGWN